jgi:hypothetical protein
MKKVKDDPEGEQLEGLELPLIEMVKASVEAGW